MAYLSLYRKYRPQRFADVTGQTPVVRTLQNALERGRVAHAYMFSGPRGTGKTTLARLLAKGLNCENGPAREPCNVCANCQRINDGAAMDVIEIDGASNRGIDEIRYLRENVRTGSTEGGYKVYIIDEVHMLTTDAFNALLKTLEEPPGHVVFVLATTEAHKVPETIASRCQRFEFRNFTDEQLVARLRQVVDVEGIQVAPDALKLIARHAQGGMRDALALLDQAISFQGDGIEEIHIAQLLGVVPADQIWGFLDSLAAADGVSAITQLHQLIEEGADPAQLTKDCVSFLRDLMLSKAQDNLGELDGVGGKFPHLTAMEIGQTLDLIDALAEAIAAMRWMSPPWLPLEMAIIRATDKVALQEVSPAPTPASDHVVPTLKATTKSEAANHEIAAGGATKGEMAKGEEIPTPDSPIESPRHAAKVANEAEETASGSERSFGTTATSSHVPDEEFQTLLARWDQVSDILRQERNAPVEAFLKEATPVGIDEHERLVLAFSKDREFHKVSLEQPKSTEVLQRCLFRVVGRPIEIICCYEDELPVMAKSKAQATPPSAHSAAKGQNIEQQSANSRGESPKQSREGQLIAGDTNSPGMNLETETGNPTLDAALRIFEGDVKVISDDS